MLIGHDVSDSANNTAVHRDTLKYKNLVHMKLLRAAFQDPTTDASCKETRNIKRQTQTSSSVRCGFSLSRNLTDLYNIKASCYRTLTPGETTITGTLSHGKGAQVLFTDGIQVHEAWAISWAGSDTATMSPSLPTLTNSMIVPTWVPGEIIPPARYDRGYEGSDMPGWEPILRFLMIGVPIIGVALLAASVWCCIWCRRVRRKERQQRGVLANPQEICTTPLQST
ncbi:hypothetical protein CNMCM6936_002132 [Aspergillus lentulus]|nr:hypothetical protein CNMCM6936_002132 [Aspergillus lentulus]